MYKIRGQDDKDLGPFTAVVVRQWISAGRADADTLLLKVGEGEWKPLSQFPEFTKAPVSRDSGPPSQESASLRRNSDSRPASDSTPPVAFLSRLAVTSVGLGAVGLLGVTAVAGLVAGVLALKAIARSGGRLKGTGLAVTGTVLSASMLLVFVPAMSGLIIVPLMQKRQAAADEACLENMRKLNQALHIYAGNHGHQLPDAGNWLDLLAQDRLVVRDGAGLQCPSRSGLSCAYAFNEALSGLDPAQVPGDTVLIFESNLGWNGHGSVEDLADSRHGMQLLIGFADGSVERVPAYQLPQLRWLPVPTP